MERWTLACSCFALVALAAASSRAATPSSPLDFHVKSITGQDVDLSQYKGKVVLVVNVASKCGNTKQYTPLEKMYTDLKDKGFVVLGFPANEFGKQEPGSNEDVLKFCTETYKVDFPMFAKSVVKGDGISPLYAYLTDATTDPGFAGPITWNFEKFLIGRDGKVVARFKPKTSPDSPEVMQAIETELAKK